MGEAAIIGVKRIEFGPKWHAFDLLSIDKKPPNGTRMTLMTQIRTDKKKISENPLPPCHQRSIEFANKVLPQVLHAPVSCGLGQEVTLEGNKTVSE